MRNFKKITAWQKADDFAFKIYQLTKGFPRDELFGITSQIRRAAVSVAANIAEGSAKRTKADYLHYINIAQGSLSEARSYLHFAKRLSYLSEKEYACLSKNAEEVSKTLYGLMKSIKSEI